VLPLSILFIGTNSKGEPRDNCWHKDVKFGSKLEVKLVCMSCCLVVSFPTYWCHIQVFKSINCFGLGLRPNHRGCHSPTCQTRLNWTTTQDLDFMSNSHRSHLFVTADIRMIDIYYQLLPPSHFIRAILIK
jgi:hypothetical protein